MENSVPMATRGFIILHPKEYFHDVEVIRGRLNAYGREAELEPGDIMGRALRGGLEIILEGVSDFRNADNEVVGNRYGKNHTECRF